jgi:Tol biopolymer transport system component
LRPAGNNRGDERAQALRLSWLSLQSGVHMRSRLLAFLSIIALASCSGCPGCSQGPRPAVAIGAPATASNAARVTATITPNQFPVTKVILEFGRRPSANNAVNILYSSEPGSYNLSHTFEPPTLPTTAPFEATFRFPGLTPGELVDYQFRVTHRTAEGNELFFWSERKMFQVTQGAAQPPGGGPVSGGGAAGCDSDIANVSRPANSIGGGAIDDLGGRAPAVSADGQFVAFTTRMKFDPNAADVDQVYRRNVQTGEVVPVSRPATGIGGGATTDRGGTSPSISADGQRVAFVTRTQFDPNAADVDQIYVRDLASTNVLRVTTPTGGTADRGGSAPVISGNGQFVAFVSRTAFDPQAADVDQIYRRNVNTGEILPVTRPARSISGGAVTDLGGRAPSISDDGRFVAFVSRTKFDPNAADVDQIYVRNLDTGDILPVTTPAQSASGGATTDLGGGVPRISGDGRFVAFVTRTKFDANASDSDQIYRRDLQTGSIQAVTRPATSTSGGAVTDLGGRLPTISTNGRRIGFLSVTKFDANAADVDQLYVRDLESGNILRVSTPANGISGGATTDRGGTSPVISGDGRFVVFVTRTQFDANAANGVDEIYRRCLPD